MKLDTIRIKDESGGFYTINASDFVSSKHEKYDTEKAPDGGRTAEVIDGIANGLSGRPQPFSIPASGSEAGGDPSPTPGATASVPPTDPQPEKPKKKGKR